MSLVMRLLLIGVGLFGAFYALAMGHTLSAVRLPAVLSTLGVPPTAPKEWLAMMGVAFILTAIAILSNLVGLSRRHYVPYFGIIWTMAVLIFDAALLGMLTEPNMRDLPAWFLGAPATAQSLAIVVVLPLVLLLLRILFMIGAAMDAYVQPQPAPVVQNVQNQPKGPHPLAAQADRIEALLELLLDQTGCYVENDNWQPTTTSLNDKLVLLLEHFGFKFDAQKTWSPPEGVSNDDFKNLHGRFDGLFAALKRIEAGNKAIAGQVAASTQRGGTHESS